MNGNDCATTGGPAERDFWRRSVVGWHAAFVVVVLLATVLPLLEDGTDGSTVLRNLGLGAVMLTSYALVGRHLLGNERASFAAFGYLTSVWVPFLVLVRTTDIAYVLLFVLFPQVWAMLPTRAAVATTVGVCAALVVTRLLAGEAPAEVVGMGVVNLALSLLLGLWITGIVDESERRRTLIDELRRTRDELAAAERERGVLAERQRLAHEIHDTLAQGFTSIIALAQAIEATLDTDPSTARERLRLLQSTARTDLEEARALVADLGPADLRDASLADALGRVVERVGRELDVPARLVVEGTPRQLGAAAEVVLLRSAQEGLANVRKHARAGSVVVRLAYAPEGATVEVCDDGQGFDPERADGFGLPAMRRRVAELGGRIRIDSTAGSGTRLHVWVPQP